MSYNLADLTKDDMDKVNVDLAASGVAYKERMNMPVIPAEVASQQPSHLREYFLDRLAHYRGVSKQFPGGSAPVYLQMSEQNGKK